MDICIGMAVMVGMVGMEDMGMVDMVVMVEGDDKNKIIIILYIKKKTNKFLYQDN